MRVQKVETATRFVDLGPLIRVNPEDRERLKQIETALASGQYKVILVHTSMRNDSGHKRNLGFSIGSSYDHCLWLRGDEGSEVRCFDQFSFEAPAAAGRLTYHLNGGFPLSAESAPKTVVSGKVAFVVPQWFQPAKMFTKTGPFGPKEVVIEL
jgi:hypothetical protein